MITLRIEHEIHDYQIWQKAFDSFAEARAKAGDLDRELGKRGGLRSCGTAGCRSDRPRRGY